MSNPARPAWTEGAKDNAAPGPARGTKGTGKAAKPAPGGKSQGGSSPSAGQGASAGSAGNGQPNYRQPRPAPPSARPDQRQAATPSTPRRPAQTQPAGQSGYKPPASTQTRPSAATEPTLVTKDVPTVTPKQKARAKSGDGVQAATKASAPRTRKAQLRLSRLDPWSVMKTSLLLSVAFGIVTWVAVFVVWSAIGAAGVFENINRTVSEVLGTPAAEPFRIEDYISTGKVMGFTTLIAVADVFIITALATLGSFLYNIAATLLGGLEVTLSSED